MARTLLWLLVSLLVTVAGTLLLWHLVGPYAFFGFLFLPFLFSFRGFGRGQDEPRAARTCARCGYATMDPQDRYCPRDGTPLS